MMNEIWFFMMNILIVFILIWLGKLTQEISKMKQKGGYEV